MLCRRSERQPRNVYPAGRKRQEKKNKVGGRREEPPCSIQAQTTSSLALLYIYTELVAAELPGKGLYCVRANTQKCVSSWIKSGIKFSSWMEENSGQVNMKNAVESQRQFLLNFNSIQNAYLLLTYWKKASLFPQNYFIFESNFLIAESQSFSNVSCHMNIIEKTSVSPLPIS